jgi:hypothetical protein
MMGYIVTGATYGTINRALNYVLQTTNYFKGQMYIGFAANVTA